MAFYSLNICGLTRKLPIKYISKKTQLANFCVLGDVELVNIMADQLADKLKKVDFDYVVAFETKIVPVAHGVALRLKHKRFVVCRKSIKPHMISPIVLKPLPHFPKHVQPLVIDGSDAKMILGKKVVVIDTVISTGVTMRMMTKLMEKLQATIIKRIAVLRQGDQFEQYDNLITLGEIPVFKEDV